MWTEDSHWFLLNLKPHEITKTSTFSKQRKKEIPTKLDVVNQKMGLPCQFEDLGVFLKAGLFKLHYVKTHFFKNSIFKSAIASGPSQTTRRKACTVDHFHQNCSQFYICERGWYKKDAEYKKKLLVVLSWNKIVTSNLCLGRYFWVFSRQ